MSGNCQTPWRYHFFQCLMYLQYILCYGYVLCVFGFFIVCVSVCECVCAYMTHHTRESQKTLLFWSKFSFFLPCGSLGWNSDHWSCLGFANLWNNFNKGILALESYSKIPGIGMDSLVLPNLTTVGRTKEISWDGMLTCIHSTVKTIMGTPVVHVYWYSRPCLAESALWQVLIWYIWCS